MAYSWITARDKAVEKERKKHEGYTWETTNKKVSTKHIDYDWNRPKTRFARTCSYCDRQFRTNRSNQKYCSQKCSYWAHRKKPQEKECLVCSVRFTTVKRIYCSKKCRGRAQSQRRPKGETRIKNVFDRVATVRWCIFNRDDFRCQYCGRTAIEDHVKLHLDHIKPRTDGGGDDFENLVTACRDCNIGKMDTPLRHEAEFKARLNRRLL